MSKQFDQWAVLELMGHRRLAGRVSEETIGGASFIRIDVPEGATQFYSPGAVYCITPTSEDLARRFAKHNRPRPVKRYEIPAPERQPTGSLREAGIPDELAADPEAEELSEDQGGRLDIEILPTDRAFTDSPDAGDAACLCSRCGKPIEKPEVPIRAWCEGGGFDPEYRYHAACLKEPQ